LHYQVGVTSKGSTFCNGETKFATVPTSREWFLDVIATV
jgi:hypothetical protein